MNWGKQRGLVFEIVVTREPVISFLASSWELGLPSDNGGFIL